MTLEYFSIFLLINRYGRRNRSQNLFLKRLFLLHYDGVWRSLF